MEKNVQPMFDKKSGETEEKQQNSKMHNFQNTSCPCEMTLQISILFISKGNGWLANAKVVTQLTYQERLMDFLCSSLRMSFYSGNLHAIHSRNVCRIYLVPSVEEGLRFLY